jgi:polysaccharide biosynthesis/export protein
VAGRNRAIRGRSLIHYALSWLAAASFAPAALHAAAETADRPAPLVASASPVQALRLAPGDSLEIKFFYVPELNEIQTVRPDGRISLQMVGDVDVTGRTPAELREHLFALYAPHLKKPDVTILVRSQANRRVYVAGEVAVPGLLPLDGPMTVLEAIMQAGGFNQRTARVKNVVLIRHQDGKRLGAALDLRAALKGKPSDPFYLEPLDIIYVPKTRVARAAQWIDTHINQLVPILGIEYTRPAGDGTITRDTTRGRAFR